MRGLFSFRPMKMTKDRAISLLRRYRQGEPSPPMPYHAAAWKMFAYGKRAYTKCIVQELIQRIRDSPETMDPLELIRSFLHEIDEVAHAHRADPKRHRITWDFCSNVVSVLDSLMQYLGDEERKETKNEEG